MLDGDGPEKAERVWGFAVPTRSSDQRKWPEALRAMAVERIAAGEGIRKIAEVIGANKSLVAVWVKSAQREDPMPAFFEVVPPIIAVKPGHQKREAVAPEDAASTCRISIGDADIAIPPGYPADHLAEVLRAVRASQCFPRPAASASFWHLSRSISAREWTGWWRMSPAASISTRSVAPSMCSGPAAPIG